MIRLCRAVTPVVTLLLAGCAVSYSLVSPGPVAVGDLDLSPATAWNQAPASLSPWQRHDAQVWTQEGLLLDRLLIIPAVPSGESVFLSRDPSAALPVFRAGMLPNELEELAESSITKLFGEGEAVVETLNLRPQRFGEHAGVLFDLAIKVSESPDYRGLAGAFVAADKLYMMIYVAADPYFFGKHLEKAQVLITGARLGNS